MNATFLAHFPEIPSKNFHLLSITGRENRLPIERD